jgi:hypothetical protein
MQQDVAANHTDYELSCLLQGLVQKHGDKSDAEAIKELVTVISNVIKDASDPESLLENGNLLAEIEEHGERIVITICE